MAHKNDQMVGWWSAKNHIILYPNVHNVPTLNNSEHLWTRSSDASTLTHWHWEWASSGRSWKILGDLGRSWKILEPQPQGPAGPCAPCICCSASSHSQSTRYPPDLQSPHHLEQIKWRQKIMAHLALSMVYLTYFNLHLVMTNRHSHGKTIHGSTGSTMG